MNTDINKHFELLGFKAKDKIRGTTGVITSLSFDLYGCVSALISPPEKKGVRPDSCWFDVTRIEIIGKKPVMDLPDYGLGYVAQGKKGAAKKPIQ